MVAPGTWLAVRPSRTGGGYSEHFDRVVGLSTSMKTGFIDVKVAAYSKWSAGRHAQTLQVLLAHDPLAEEVASTPNFDKVVRAAVDGEEWAQNCRTHQVVPTEPPYTALTLAVYLDGAAFLRTDSCLGNWVVNLVTERRYLVATLRKRALCRCGCRCSLISSVWSGSSHKTLQASSSASKLSWSG